MSNKQVIKAQKISDIKITDIVIGSKKTNKTVPITYNGKSKMLVCQTPFLEVKGDLRKTPYPNIYQLDTLFKGDGKLKIHELYQFIEKLETHISEQVMNNGSQWFTQKNIIIKSLIRELDAEKEVYFIKWPINLETNIFVDENKNSFNPSNLKEKDLVKLIIEISNLWVDENQCGLAAHVQKILVKPYSEKLQNEYIFDETDSESAGDEKENNIISLLATEQKPKVQNTNTNNANSSSVKFQNNQPPQTQNKKQIAQRSSLRESSSLQDNQPNDVNGADVIDNNNNNIKNRQTKTKNEVPQLAQRGIQREGSSLNDDVPQPVKRPDPKIKENLERQKKLVLGAKDFGNQKTQKQPVKSQPIKTPLQNVFLDEDNDSDENNNDNNFLRNENNGNFFRNENNKFSRNERNLKQLLEEYTPSSDEAEINEDDLDFDGDN